MIRHHPDDALLMALASGAIASGTGLVVAVHAERCARCARRLREYDAVGGALLEATGPATLAEDLLARTLARLDALPAAAPQEPVAPRDDGWKASLPTGADWPRALRGSRIEPWRRLGAHLRFSRVTVAGDEAANVYLLRAPAGRALPVHSHRGGEVTQVLHGAFQVGRDRYGTGDFTRADERDHHEPVVTPAGECVCLIAVEGRVAFDGTIARVVGSLLKM